MAQFTKDIWWFIRFCLRPAGGFPDAKNWWEAVQAILLPPLSILGTWIIGYYANLGVIERLILLGTIFIFLALIGGARLIGHIRKLEACPLNIRDKVFVRGSALEAGETYSLGVENQSLVKMAKHAQGQILEYAQLYQSMHQRTNRYPCVNLQWSPSSRVQSNEESTTDIMASTVAYLDVIHHRAFGCQSSIQKSPKFLFAYANDKPLSFAHIPLNEPMLLLISLKAEEGRPIYVICCIDSEGQPIIKWEEDPQAPGVSSYAGSSGGEHLTILAIEANKPSKLAMWQKQAPGK